MEKMLGNFCPIQDLNNAKKDLDNLKSNDSKQDSQLEDINKQL